MVMCRIDIEESRLNFFRKHQKEIRADTYKEIKEMKARGATAAMIGKCVILPSSHPGSPRQMRQLYEDAMASIRVRGKPDYFLTMTCNPDWPEIQQELRHGQKAQDRPDLCARVFNMKFEQLKKDIMEHEVLGKCTLFIHTIEYQKRGLPHAHCLIIVEGPEKPKDANTYDRSVCAEIPRLDGTPERTQLRQKVLRHMVHQHRPTCFAEEDIHQSECRSGYPKQFQTSTTDTADGYPAYRRRSPEHGGDTAHVAAFAHKYHRNVNNGDVVPYNPYLLQKYNCPFVFRHGQTRAD